MYYQSNIFPGRGLLTPAVRFLLISTGIVFLAQLFGDSLTGGKVTLLFGLSWPGMRHLFLWQPVTYIFLHGGLLHILLNMLGLFFFGPDTERAIGTKRFLWLYFICGILGGLGWLLLTGRQTPFPCIGASGAIFGILGAFAALFPARPITLLLFFVIPVTMQARTLALALAIFSLLFMAGQAGNIAYAAHLAGGLTGYLYIVIFYNRPWPGRFAFRNLFNDLIWHWHRRKFKVISGAANRFEEENEAPTGDEVNEVLEKLSKRGINNLSARERDILKRASKTWRR